MANFQTLISLITNMILLSGLAAGVIKRGGMTWWGVLDGTNREFTFVKFFSHNCIHSQALAPIFEETALIFQNDPRMKLAEIDCDESNGVSNGAEICDNQKIEKVPTLRLFRRGIPMRLEYKGKRTTEAIAKYLRHHLESPVRIASNLAEALKLDSKDRYVVLLMKKSIEHTEKAGKVIENLKETALWLRDDCSIISYIGSDLPGEFLGKSAFKIRFFNPAINDSFVDFEGDAANKEELTRWADDHCLPLTEQLNFDNSEHIAEKGVPLLILFHHPDDKKSVKLFAEAVKAQLHDHRFSLKAVFADGTAFKLPLKRLGKTEKDLPFLAIDDFKHLYLLPLKMNEIKKDWALRKASFDLYAGKLHQDFHDKAKTEIDSDYEDGSVPDLRTTERRTETTGASESAFVKLGPSNQRYTFRKSQDGEL